ncbi:MAG: hypothetical protein JW759_07225 [Candidatus Coatesbacteria bacterium]|nr:hypothetical protein [Candidatus Coatesbacteria bacterium]
MGKGSCFLLMLLVTSSFAYAQGFVLYDNPFAGAEYPGVAADGTLWFRAGEAWVVSFESSTRLHSKFYVSKPSSWRRGLTIDVLGRVWTASGSRADCVSQGLVTWHEFDKYIQAIAASPDGSVWCSSYGPWLWRFDGDAWAPVERCPEECATQMCFESDGTGWFAAARVTAMFWRYKEGEWTVFEDGMPFTEPTDIAVGAPGEVWITDRNFAHRFQDGVLVHSYGPDDGLPAYTATYVDVDAVGRVWVGSYSRGVSVFDGQQWTVFNTLNSGLLCNNTTGVAASPDGTVFICTSFGLSGYDRGLWNVYAGQTVMSNDIYSVGVNDQGLVFYGGGSGELGYYRAPNWEVLYQPETFGVKEVYDIVFDHGGGIWFGQQDMVRLWNGAFINYSRAGQDGIPLAYCKRLCCDQTDSVWVCAKDGLARHAGTSWVSWETDHANGISPESITCDGDGKVRVGIPPGVATLDNEALVNWLPQYPNVTAMTCDLDGILWFGFKDRGVLQFDGSQELAWYTMDDVLPSNWINCIECDAANHIWVGTNDGLAYFDRTQWTKWDIDSGLPVNEMRDISVAPNGDAWFATPAGLLCRESGVQPPKLSISIATDQALYHAGDTMTVSLSYENPGPSVFVDIQIACLLPDGSLYYYPGGDTPVPFSSGLLPSGASIPMVLVLTYELPSGFPVGGYTWMTAMFQQGTFNMLTDIATAPFTFE